MKKIKYVGTTIFEGQRQDVYTAPCWWCHRPMAIAVPEGEKMKQMISTCDMCIREFGKMRQ